MSKHSWKDLIVWQKAHQLVIDIYKTANSFPESEKYNLTSQIKRAAVSVPTNIVEGHDRNSVNEFIRFLYISRGSLEEVRYLFLLAKDLGYANEITYQETERKCSEISILLNNLIKSIKEIPV
ncbi:MAG TPA: four helix bundle protein [Bacteroidales bacterium]|nr:four helix bundle protein [Bacteroidales bacterium]